MEKTTTITTSRQEMLGLRRTYWEQNDTTVFGFFKNLVREKHGTEGWKFKKDGHDFSATRGVTFATYTKDPYAYTEDPSTLNLFQFLRYPLMMHLSGGRPQVTRVHNLLSGIYDRDTNLEKFLYTKPEELYTRTGYGPKSHQILRDEFVAINFNVEDYPVFQIKE